MRAGIFSGVVVSALIFILFPVFPGPLQVQESEVAAETIKVQGQVIVRQGEVISASAMEQLRDGGLVGVHLEGDAVAAAVLVALLGSLALGGYLYLFQPREVSSLPRLLLLALLILLWVAAAKLLLAQTLPDNDRRFLAYMLPVAAAPMVVAALLDATLAVAVVAILAFLATFAGFYQPDARASLAGNPLEAYQMASVYMLGGLVGIYAVHRAERVHRYLAAGGAVTFVSFVGLLLFWLLDARREMVDLPWMLLATGLGGLLSAIITVGAFVVLGLLFGITTRIQLMELAQLNHPLMRRLQAEAPGTFHHSVVVGNLAERAADLVGADSLMVRVGCYYHDIGKMIRPSFYIENQLDSRNPHERLDPYTSARIISAHVKAGMELARKYRLPTKVRAFISEHHGTRLVTYFYRKASQEKPDVDARLFAYAGPKPQSKETAIVMLADSVESVVRSSRDRSPERIDALAEAVISERLAERQLEDCDITLRDLKVIGASFRATLRGVYHPRVEYPPPTEREKAALAAQFLEQVPAAPVDGTAPPIEIERPA
ncbi:MAG: HDIG domain-containing protein [Chloroflexota bacterium]|nr:HDIG domain-containing protein [Chloroflexota bacterium]